MESAIKSNDIARIKELISECDINSRNEAGDTPLHIAIANSSNREIIEVLLQNGADPKFLNKRNMPPLHCIEQGDLKTIENILTLENKFDFEDSEGNTCLHTILKFRKRYVTDVGQFWRLVFKLKNTSVGYFDKPNKYGDTILMAAARAVMLPSVNEHLEYILDHIPDINVFTKNQSGENFLHILCRSFVMESNSSLIANILEGNFKNCPRWSVRKLLSEKNSVRDTPFLIIMQNMNNILNLEILRLFIAAGAAVNDSNIRGETVLHRAVLRSEGEFSFQEENFAEIISYLVKEGADIDAKDISSSTPMMLINQTDTTTALIEVGASVNIPNKFGQTPIMVKVLDDEVNLSVIDVLITRGAKVNVTDNHKSSILHYLAWQGLMGEIVSTFIEAGAEVTVDNMGQLPCDVAYYCRHLNTFNQLCRCPPLTHTSIKQNFCLRSTAADISTLSSLDINGIIKRFEPFKCRLKSDLLHLSDIGYVSFEDEANEIKTFVGSVINKLCYKFAEKDKLFTASIIESGSVGEDTKVGQPNEFDFVCILKEFSEMCEVDETFSSSEPGFAYLKHKAGRGDMRYFDSDGYFKTLAVWNICQTLLQDILQTSDLFSHPNATFSTNHRTPSNTITKPTCQFSFYWSGPFFKHLEVDVDIVLACQVKGWWPQSVKLSMLPDNIQQEVKAEGCILILQTEHNEGKHQLRISGLNAEKAFMKSLPQIARDSYILCKTLCDDRICPGVENGESQFYCREYVTSYELKTCMFHVFCEDYRNTSMQRCVDYSESELLNFVGKILLKLTQCVAIEKLESFLFPWQNVFTFLKEHKDDEDDTFLHVDCAFKKLYLNVILKLLGLPQDPTEIDVESIERYWHEIKESENDEMVLLDDYWEVTEEILAE